MKMILGELLLVVLGFIGILAWAGHPWSLNQIIARPEISHVEPADMMDVEERPSVIKIMTWNISFLYGEGSEGPGYEYRDKKFFEDKLELLVRQIKEANPDILCLQEIDFDSHRSHNINQAQILAQKAGYPYVAQAVSWESNYIPFPYWPISRNFGSMKSGGAILSKYPILSHEVTLLQKPQGNPWWYNVFYLHRYLQKVSIQLGEKTFNVINLHLEAFDKVDRLSQIKLLSDKVKNENINLVTGDFNMVPTGATKKSKFFNTDEYENDASFEVMNKSGMQEVIPEEIYLKDENQYFTFPAWNPDRRLDYIFYQPELKMMKAEILPSALSDHLPLRASFQIDSPRFNPYSQ